RRHTRSDRDWSSDVCSSDLFHYHMNDIIRAIPNSGAPGSTYANTGEQTGNGAEFEAVWDFSRSLRFTANQSYQRSEDQATNSDRSEERRVGKEWRVQRTCWV